MGLHSRSTASQLVGMSPRQLCLWKTSPETHLHSLGKELPCPPAAWISPRRLCAHCSFKVYRTLWATNPALQAGSRDWHMFWTHISYWLPLSLWCWAVRLVFPPSTNHTFFHLLCLGFFLSSLTIDGPQICTWLFSTNFCSLFVFSADDSQIYDPALAFLFSINLVF